MPDETLEDLTPYESDPHFTLEQEVAALQLQFVEIVKRARDMGISSAFVIAAYDPMACKSIAQWGVGGDLLAVRGALSMLQDQF